MNEKTSINALAEMIENEISPKPGDLNKIDIEDIVEKVRNSYSGVLWQLYMQNLSDGSRLVNTVLTTPKMFEVKDSDQSLTLEGLQIVDLPRDAGMYMVIVSGEGCRASGVPLMRSTPDAAYMTPSRIPTPQRYYRIGQELYFPDGLPEKCSKLLVLIYGLSEENDQLHISRTMADLIYKQVKDNYMPSVQVPADVTPNKNPNV